MGIFRQSSIFIELKDDLLNVKSFDEIKDMSSADVLSYFHKKSQDSVLWQRLVCRDEKKKPKAFALGRNTFFF